MEGRVLRRSVTLADQLAAVGPPPPAAVGPASAGSCNLRDLLKLRDEDELAAGRRAAAVTLASAMAAERQTSLPAPSSSSTSAAAAAAVARTLLDIIRDDQPPAPSGSGDPLVRRAVSLPAPVPTTSPPTPTTPDPHPPSPLPPPAAAATEEEGERVSLMALLEQTDRQWSAVAGSAAAAGEEDLSPAAEALLLEVEGEGEEEAGAEAAGKGVVPGSCCVCMARGKGAAFIPCGHTFCRLCARELLAGRGRCPLCNAAIVDVLDIF